MLRLLTSLQNMIIMFMFRLLTSLHKRIILFMFRLLTSLQKMMTEPGIRFRIFSIFIHFGGICIPSLTIIKGTVKEKLKGG